MHACSQREGIDTKAMRSPALTKPVASTSCEIPDLILPGVPERCLTLRVFPEDSRGGPLDSNSNPIPCLPL
jgi:hypothetical protein